MLFSTALLPLLAAVFAPLVLANKHDSCSCKNGDSLNSRMATLACENYAKAGYQNSNVAYDPNTQRCTQVSSSDYLMGDQWQEACQAIAKSGFSCADGQGTCFATTDKVRGSC